MSEPLEKTQTGQMSAFQAIAVDLAHCVRFYSRLPVPALPWEQDAHALPDFKRLARILPLAGLVIGLLPALALAVSILLDLGPWLAAALSILVMTVSTGAMHEDGLADTADSFGGVTKERRLEIMRDSRLGSYGACALVLTFALRLATLGTLVSRVDWPQAVAAVLIVSALSRTAGLLPLVFLLPARADGLARAVGQPARETFWAAAGLAGLIAVAVGALSGLPASGIGLMLVASIVSGLALKRFAARHLGGQTGDIAGATQQVAEIATLIGLLTVIAR